MELLDLKKIKHKLKTVINFMSASNLMVLKMIKFNKFTALVIVLFGFCQIEMFLAWAEETASKLLKIGNPAHLCSLSEKFSSLKDKSENEKWQFVASFFKNDNFNNTTESRTELLETIQTRISTLMKSFDSASDFIKHIVMFGFLINYANLQNNISYIEKRLEDKSLTASYAENLNAEINTYKTRLGNLLELQVDAHMCILLGLRLLFSVDLKLTTEETAAAWSELEQNIRQELKLSCNKQAPKETVELFSKAIEDQIANKSIEEIVEKALGVFSTMLPFDLKRKIAYLEQDRADLLSSKANLEKALIETSDRSLSYKIIQDNLKRIADDLAMIEGQLINNNESLLDPFYGKLECSVVALDVFTAVAKIKEHLEGKDSRVLEVK